MRPATKASDPNAVVRMPRFPAFPRITFTLAERFSKLDRKTPISGPVLPKSRPAL